MTADQIAAGLFAGWVIAFVAFGVWCVWRLVAADIDQAVTLPDPRRPADDDATEPPTERLNTALIPHDLPRKRADTWL